MAVLARFTYQEAQSKVTAFYIHYEDLYSAPS